jgi:SAM-dependent methyltransferase
MNEGENEGKEEKEIVYRILYDTLYSVNPKNVPWGYETPDSDLAYIMKRINIQSNAKVLDAGCGNGKNSAYLEEKGFEIYGFDLSTQAIAVARKKVSSGHFMVADAKNLPYADETFDLIVDVGLLHCIPPEGWEPFKREVFRILKVKGYYFLREYHRPSGYPPEKPLFYENVDQSGRTFFEKDITREQIPVWSFNIPQIRDFFREYRIRAELYGPNRLLVLVSKEKKEVKSWRERIGTGIESLLKPNKVN